MTAFRPESDDLTAYEELGGLRPPLTQEYVEAIGEDALRIVSPALAARRDASRYYQNEFGLSGVATDMDDETREAMHRTIKGLREKTLPGMINDPERQTASVPSPEDQGREIVRNAHESWDELEVAQTQGRLF